jgi:hypothetical protein
MTNCSSLLLIVAFFAPAVTVAAEEERDMTNVPLVHLAQLTDPNGWVQGFRYEVFNPDRDHAVALVVRKVIEDELLMIDAQGFPISEPAKPKAIIDPVDPKDRDYRYQIITPQSSFVMYVALPRTVVDRKNAQKEKPPLIPIPNGTYTINLFSALYYTRLSQGVDTYTEDPAHPPTFVRTKTVVPNTFVVKADEKQLVPDFFTFVVNTLKDGNR